MAFEPLDNDFILFGSFGEPANFFQTSLFVPKFINFEDEVGEFLELSPVSEDFSSLKLQVCQSPYLLQREHHIGRTPSEAK